MATKAEKAQIAADAEAAQIVADAAMLERAADTNADIVTGENGAVIADQNGTRIDGNPVADDHSAIAETPLGMTPVRSSSVDVETKTESPVTVTMSKDDVTMDIDSRDVEAHRRMGWVVS